MPLNTKNLTDVEVTQPIVEDGLYHARVTAKEEPNKVKDGTNLVLDIELIDENICRRDNGEQIERVIRLRHWTSLKRTEKYDPDENLRKLADGFGVDLTETGGNVEIDHFHEQVVQVQLGYEAASEKYGESNRVIKFLPKSDDFIDPAM